MALLTDGTVSTIGDLAAYESAILEVARTEGIDLTIKLGLAREEIAIDLETVLSQQSESLYEVIPASRPDLSKIVVTDALHKWHTFRALALTYRDAYHNQLNDRYASKWQEYERKASRASTALFKIGIGMVFDPIPQADKPELTTVAGPLPAATYYVRAAWVSAIGEEGCPSELNVLSAPDGNLLVVNATNAPANARAWNIYAGPTYEAVQLQNQTAIPIGQSWTEPATGLSAGKKPGNGQEPDTYLQANPNRILQRG